MGCCYKGKPHHHHPVNDVDVSVRFENILVQLQEQIQEQRQFQQQLQQQLQQQRQRQNQDQDQRQAQLDNDYSNFENIGNPTINVRNDITIVIVLVILLFQRTDGAPVAGLEPLVPELMSMLKGSMDNE